MRSWLWCWGGLVMSGLVAAAAGADLQSRLNVPYVAGDAADPLQRLDAFWLPEVKDQPVMVYVHGGGWRRGDKRAVGQKPEAFAKHGFAFVSVNYRLHPQVGFREQSADVAKAIRHVIDTAGKVGVKADSLYLMGHSAGAHLAAMVATDEKYLQAEGLPLSTIKGVVLLDGAGYDIPTRLKLARPEAETLFETVFGSDPAEQKEASPITHVAAGKGIAPFLILPIAARPESGAQSKALAERLRAAGGDAQVVACPNQTHGSINQDFGTAEHLATEETFRFLHMQQEKQLRKSLPAPPPARSPE
ncbi:MAG: alpha/beta hydrolase [Planctomycetaceae bacterium]